jgi:syndecan 4
VPTPRCRCGVCPEGLTGNGTWCNDLDECDLADPCDVAATCYNLIPGFRCGPCPQGYTGSTGFTGVGLDYAARQRQVPGILQGTLYISATGVLRYQRV